MLACIRVQYRDRGGRGGWWHCMNGFVMSIGAKCVNMFVCTTCR